MSRDLVRACAIGRAATLRRGPGPAGVRADGLFSPAGWDTPTWAQATCGGRVPTCRANACGGRPAATSVSRPASAHGLRKSGQRTTREARAMQVETDEPEIIERVAALDIGKAEVVCCARVPGPDGRRMQEVRTTSTMTSELLALGDWLAELGVSRVVMEATSDYWRAAVNPLGDALEARVAKSPTRHNPRG